MFKNISSNFAYLQNHYDSVKDEGKLKYIILDYGYIIFEIKNIYYLHHFNSIVLFHKNLEKILFSYNSIYKYMLTSNNHN